MIMAVISTINHKLLVKGPKNNPQSYISNSSLFAMKSAVFPLYALSNGGKKSINRKSIYTYLDFWSFRKDL